MKALICRSFNDDLNSLRLEDTTLPPLGAEEVRMKMRAASVNFTDLLMAAGKYQFKPELPYTIGSEMAGEVIAVGAGVTRFKPGDAVLSAGLTGAFAEEVQRPAASVRPLPEGADFATASSYMAAYLTAYVALVRRAQLQAGEWLLVHGAASGVGLAAVDLGRVLGARIIATASSDEKRAFLKSYGADHVLPPTGFRNAVKALTDGDGADVIYDPVGGDVFDESVRAIAFDGRLLVVGFAGGRISTLSVNLPLIKGFSVVGVRAGEYGRKSPEKGREDIEAITRLFAEKKIRPHVGARLPLARAVDAMQLLQDRKAIGKVVIET